MKKLLLWLTGIVFPTWADLRDDITAAINETMTKVNEQDTNIDYADIAKEIQYWIFVFIGVISIAYIIYIGAKLLWAPGSMEEMTKAIKSFVYIVVGLALIPFAYFLVSFIMNIRL